MLSLVVSTLGLRCYDSGWRNAGDATGNSSQCPAGQRARGEGDFHECSGTNGVCDETNCCQAQCWPSGWRDNGDSSGSHECPSGQKARGQHDGTSISHGSTNPASECCFPQCWAAGWRNSGDTSGNSSRQCPAGQRARFSDDIHLSSVINEAECCQAVTSENCWYHGAGEGWRIANETTTGGTKYCPAGKQARRSSDGHRPTEFSESECCQRTCWGAGWRDSGDASGTNQCPATTEARGSMDGHDCGDDCAESECCQTTCWLLGWRDAGDTSGTQQCPATTEARSSEDGHPADSQSECCKVTCGRSGFADQSSCAAGTQLRSAGHPCSSSVARSSGLCKQGECCSQTCSDAGYTTGGTMSCPAGMAHRTGYHDCKMGKCSDAECCGVTKTGSGTCWDAGFRDSTAETTQGTFQCAAGKAARPQDDWHTCFGGTCFTDDCCEAKCWASGWRALGDSSGTSQCPASSDARSSDDRHHCSDGVCDQADCCRVQCWSSGWRDSGDSSGSHQCPSGQIARDQDDGHGCSGGVCDASECCGETCAAIDPASCPAGKQRKRGEEICHGGACSTDHCCRVGCQVWANTGNTCSGDLALNTDEGCDGEEISGCNAEKCCAHPLEIKCQTSEAAGCSKCAKYAPCVSSIDPRCIRQEALDCLYCKTLGVIDCAVCTPEWDNKCYATEMYGDEACTDLKYSIPSKFDECYLQPFDASSGYTIANTDGTYKSGCTDATCSSCEESSNYNFAEYKSSLAEGACTVEGDDDEGRKTRGLIDETKPGNPCPTAAPCGPASCVPGVDKKCIVFTVFGNASTCQVAEISTDLQGDGVETGSGTTMPVGDYHAYAIGDDTCRLDGNGRSYYKLTIDRGTDSGTGVIGCTDAACSVGCGKVAMTRAVCSTPSWANGLQLVANAIVSDWPVVMAYTHTVTMAVTIAGTIEQFTPLVLTSMRQKVADEASVPLEAVEATATAASVIVKFTVSMPSEAAASVALVAIKAKLADKTAASTFLSTPALTVTVEKIEAPVMVVLVYAPPSQPPSADDSISIAMIGGIAGGAVGVCLILALLGGLFYLKSKKKAAAADNNAGNPVKV